MIYFQLIKASNEQQLAIGKESELPLGPDAYPQIYFAIPSVVKQFAHAGKVLHGLRPGTNEPYTHYSASGSR